MKKKIYLDLKELTKKLMEDNNLKTYEIFTKKIKQTKEDKQWCFYIDDKYNLNVENFCGFISCEEFEEMSQYPIIPFLTGQETIEKIYNKKSEDGVILQKDLKKYAEEFIKENSIKVNESFIFTRQFKFNEELKLFYKHPLTEWLETGVYVLLEVLGITDTEAYKELGTIDELRKNLEGIELEELIGYKEYLEESLYLDDKEIPYRKIYKEALKEISKIIIKKEAENYGDRK